MNTPIIPFWFKQRQCKLEPQADGRTLKVSGPNLREAYLSVRAVSPESWEAALRLDPAGPDVATAAAEEPSEKSAWNAAFELYRTHIIT